MKKIDKLLVQSFIGPFFVAFMVALFVLTLQYLWVQLDDIMGRGVDFFQLVEIIGYLCVSLFPMALPLGVLISSVMVMGNLAERYELTSMKSAGIPLVRVMMPLGCICLLVALFSFYSANYLIPFSNLQFKSKLYDIKNKKATLSLREGTFNYDFKGFVIYIGKKDENGRDIEDVIIYDEENSTSKGISVTTAKSGEMYTVQDGRYFVMNLFDGVRNQETNKRYVGKDKNYPFVRTTFEKHHMVFDLSQFDDKETDQELFKTHQSMKSISKLLEGIDSLDVKIQGRELTLYKSIYRSFYLEMKKDSVNFPPIGKSKNIPDSTSMSTNVSKTDSIRIAAAKTTARLDSLKKANAKKTVDKSVVPSTVVKKSKPIKKNKTAYFPSQRIDKPLAEYPNMSETFLIKDRAQLFVKARNAARNIHSAASSSFRSLDLEREKKVKHIYLLHSKLTNAYICFLFLFIGGPMGAIIRKGGFGMPLLISIGFFVTFIFLNLLFEKLAESFVLPAPAAAWMPILILTPIAILLTYQATSDKQIISFDRVSNAVNTFKNYNWVKKVFSSGEGDA